MELSPRYDALNRPSTGCPHTLANKTDNSGKYEGNPYNELMSNKHGSTGEFDFGFALNDGSFIHATGAFSYNNALGKSIPTSHVVRLARNADAFEAWGNVITQTIYCVFCAKQF
jgi:hypothetical protein